MEENKAKKAYRKALGELLTEVLAILVILFITFTFVFGVHVQRGNGMYPALRDGDIVIYYRCHTILNTEAVVYETDGRVLTGRVAASGGTLVSVTGDMQLTFDGNYLPVSRSDGIYERTYAAEETVIPMTIGDDSYYILGDNRGEAADSRVYGQISKKQIKGRVISVIRMRQI